MQLSSWKSMLRTFICWTIVSYLINSGTHHQISYVTTTSILYPLLSYLLLIFNFLHSPDYMTQYMLRPVCHSTRVMTFLPSHTPRNHPEDFTNIPRDCTIFQKRGINYLLVLYIETHFENRFCFCFNLLLESRKHIYPFIKWHGIPCCYKAYFKSLSFPNDFNYITLCYKYKIDGYINVLIFPE